MEERGQGERTGRKEDRGREGREQGWERTGSKGDRWREDREGREHIGERAEGRGQVGDWSGSEQAREECGQGRERTERRG